MTDHDKLSPSYTSAPNRSEKLEDYDYLLPQDLIAQYPTAKRTASRLMHVNARGDIGDGQFSELAHRLRANDVLVFNDTRVIKARLFGQKESGGKVELLIERLLDSQRVLAHVKASKTPKPGSRLRIAHAIEVQVLERHADLFELAFDCDVLEALEAHGHVPLPPYIEHADNATDQNRYQTVYARHPGAVAAPTAGLHFDEGLLSELTEMGVAQAFVTLHVGAGTFQPVRESDLNKHHMHSEWYTVSTQTVETIERARAQGGRVIAVGTTSVRALESACAANGGCLKPHQGDTALFIRPGYSWQIVDAMITNFHLPQSTLLMLVAAFIGMQPMKTAYEHAIAQQYRFFSYGDAMFLEKRSDHEI